MFSTINQPHNGSSSSRDPHSIREKDAEHHELPCLPIKFLRRCKVEFGRRAGAESRRVMTYQPGDVITDLIVTDFDDAFATLETPGGDVAYRVGRSCFVASPNF
jgi:hypothetical protein